MITITIQIAEIKGEGIGFKSDTKRDSDTIAEAMLASDLNIMLREHLRHIMETAGDGHMIEGPQASVENAMTDEQRKAFGA